jgi:hypothetical protein
MKKKKKTFKISLRILKRNNKIYIMIPDSLCKCGFYIIKDDISQYDTWLNIISTKESKDNQICSLMRNIASQISKLGVENCEGILNDLMYDLNRFEITLDERIAKLMAIQNQLNNKERPGG